MIIVIDTGALEALGLQPRKQAPPKRPKKSLLLRRIRAYPPTFAYSFCEVADGFQVDSGSDADADGYAPEYARRAANEDRFPLV